MPIDRHRALQLAGVDPPALVTKSRADAQRGLAGLPLPAPLGIGTPLTLGLERGVGAGRSSRRACRPTRAAERASRPAAGCGAHAACRRSARARVDSLRALLQIRGRESHRERRVVAAIEVPARRRWRAWRRRPAGRSPATGRCSPPEATDRRASTCSVAAQARPCRDRCRQQARQRLQRRQRRQWASSRQGSCAGSTARRPASAPGCRRR